MCLVCKYIPYQNQIKFFQSAAPKKFLTSKNKEVQNGVMAGKVNFNVIQNYKEISLGLRLFFSIFCVAQRAYEKNGETLKVLDLKQKEYSEVFDVTRQTVSKHLDNMQLSNIIKRFNDGKITVNSLFFDGSNINLSEIKNFKTLNTDLKLIFIILLCARPNGKVGLDKKELLNYLKISWICAKSYLKELVQANVIKCKYTGEIVVNPEFYYVGEELDVVLKEYKNFKSDL